MEPVREPRLAKDGEGQLAVPDRVIARCSATPCTATLGNRAHCTISR
jgi:hypothetical protein